MAYNPLDVTAGKGNTIDGPLWWVSTPVETDIDIDWNPTTAGAVRLGEGSTDGFDSAQEAEAMDKMVWGGKSLGQTYSAFKDTCVVRFASVTDPDVLKVLFGESNVTVGATEIKVKVGARQPSVGTLVVMSVTDDGRKVLFVAPRAQVDINLSRTWTDSEITTVETTFNLMADDSGCTHYEVIEPAAAA